MKKLVLFAATMLLCAGISFAQSPVKGKSTQSKTTEAKMVQTNPATTADKSAPAAKPACGKCPHHQQCGKKADVNAQPKSEVAAEKKCCNKDSMKPAAKKTDEPKTAVKK